MKLNQKVVEFSRQFFCSEFFSSSEVDTFNASLLSAHFIQSNFTVAEIIETKKKRWKRNFAASSDDEKLKNLENWFAKSNYLHTIARKKIPIFFNIHLTCFKRDDLILPPAKKMVLAAFARRARAKGDVKRSQKKLELLKQPSHRTTPYVGNIELFPKFVQAKKIIMKDISEKQWIIEFFSRFIFFSFPRWMLLIFFSALSIRIFFFLCLLCCFVSSAVVRGFYFSPRYFVISSSQHKYLVESFLYCSDRSIVKSKSWSLSTHFFSV